MTMMSLQRLWNSLTSKKRRRYDNEKRKRSWVLKEMGVGSKHFENQHEGVLEERWALVASTLKINMKGF